MPWYQNTTKRPRPEWAPESQPGLSNQNSHSGIFYSRFVHNTTLQEVRQAVIGVRNSAR